MKILIEQADGELFAMIPAGAIVSDFIINRIRCIAKVDGGNLLLSDAVYNCQFNHVDPDDDDGDDFWSMYVEYTAKFPFYGIVVREGNDVTRFLVKNKDND